MSNQIISIQHQTNATHIKSNQTKKHSHPHPKHVKSCQKVSDHINAKPTQINTDQIKQKQQTANASNHIKSYLIESTAITTNHIKSNQREATTNKQTSQLISIQALIRAKQIQSHQINQNNNRATGQTRAIRIKLNQIKSNHFTSNQTKQKH